MKIAIYEIIHLELIIPYAELLAAEDIMVHFVTNATFKNDLQEILEQKNPRFTWHFINPEDRLLSFSQSVMQFLKKEHYDLVILNSIDARHLIVAVLLQLFKPKRILINLHDVNNFLKLKPSLSIRTNIRSLGKNLLAYLANGYIVNAENMKEYITRNRLTQKPIHWLPSVYYKPQLSNTNTSPTNTIVIPGSIDERRRDYILVLEVIKEILDRQVPIKWILAGRPVGNYGISIIKKAKELNDLGADIHFYKEEIPEQEFQKIIATSSLLLSPLVLSTSIHDNISEKYGESKSSGNVYDAIRHAKILLLPSEITIPKEITTSCIFYNSKKSIVELLLKLISDQSFFMAYNQQAYLNSLKFTKDKSIQQLKNVISV